ncbi:hypothetical protein ACNO5E_01960 [Vibrio parahaemolyticus]
MGMIEDWLYQAQRAIDGFAGDLPFDWRWIAAVLVVFVIWRLFSFSLALVKIGVVVAIVAAAYAFATESTGFTSGSFFGF